MESTGTQRSVLSLPSGTWMAHWSGPSGRKTIEGEIDTFADAHAGVTEKQQGITERDHCGAAVPAGLVDPGPGVKGRGRW